MRVGTMHSDDARWWEFVSSHPSAGPFHLPAWTTIIAECYRFESFALVVRDSGGEIVAGAPVVAAPTLLGRPRWVSLPFSDSCPLLVRAGTDVSVVTAALAEYVLAGKASELELRWALPTLPGCHPIPAGYRHYVELPSDPKDLHPRKSYRNVRNRARSRGVRVVRGTSADDVARYYRLHALTRRRLGVPVQPRRFFDLIGARLLASGHGFVATAILDGEPLAASLYLAYNGTLLAKFGASQPGRMDTGAGHLLDWEMMSTACSEGFHTLDFGRTDLGADGLRQYKTGWGAVEETLVYTHVSAQAPKAARPDRGGLSHRIIRSSPVWVSRAIGEVLYRWTA
jgi:hypothetical protein